MPADAGRCPKCGWTYGWGGGYCTHCRHGFPDRPRWDGFRSLHDFPAVAVPRRTHLLFGVACLRRLGPRLNAVSRRRLDAVEAWADGRSVLPIADPEPASPPDLALDAVAAFAGAVLPSRSALIATAGAAVRAVDGLIRGWTKSPPSEAAVALRAAGDARRAVAVEVRPDSNRAAPWADRPAVERSEEAAQCHLFRDVVPYPFEPVAFDPDWRTPSAVAVARTMYEARDFVHIPILADALEDAGCADPRVIGHCRDPEQPHVRGCWVVEAVLAPAGN